MMTMARNTVKDTDMKEKQEKARRDESVTGDLHLVYFFLADFSADFVTRKNKIQNKDARLQPWDSLLVAFSVLSTDLMTPTATVCLMSRTAKRPRGGYSL